MSRESNLACSSILSVTTASFAILCRSTARRSLFVSSFSACAVSFALLSFSLEIVNWDRSSSSSRYKASFWFLNSEHRSTEEATRSFKSLTASSNTLCRSYQQMTHCGRARRFTNRDGWIRAVFLT